MKAYMKSLVPKQKSACSAVGLDKFGDLPEWSPGKALILWGPSGAGKTSLAKALLPTALFVSHVDQLKSFDPSENGGIIFDDMSFLHWPQDAQIHLVDYDDSRAINVRYVYATIPEQTKKIFTSNKYPYEIFNTLHDAIKRRVQIWKMEDKDTIIKEL